MSKKKGGAKDFDKPCEYDVESEGKKQVLRLDCRECEYSGHDLNVTQCYRSALNAFQQEVNIDIITTSHHLETQYVGPAVELFGHLSKLRQDLEELSNRDTVAEYSKSDPKGKYRTLCPKCKANPKNIFPNLEVILKKNPKEFINVFKKSISEVPQTNQAQMCASCMNIVAEELEFAFNSYQEMVRKVMRYGFNIEVV